MQPCDRDSSDDGSSAIDGSDSDVSYDVSPAASPGAQRPFVLRINLASCKYPVCECYRPATTASGLSPPPPAHPRRAASPPPPPPPAVRVVQRQLGWAEVGDEDAHLFWCDTSAGTERLVRLARPQRLNHFPGMLDIARKKGLARNLANMRCACCGPLALAAAPASCHWRFRASATACAAAGCHHRRLAKCRTIEHLARLPAFLLLPMPASAAHLPACRALFPEHYVFSPPTFLLPEMAENGTTTRMAILQGETILMPCKAYSLGQRTVRYSFFFFFFFCNDDVWSLRIDICGTEPSYPCNAPTFRLFSLHYIKVFELLTEREEKKGRKKGRKMDGMSSLSLS